MSAPDKHRSTLRIEIVHFSQSRAGDACLLSDFLGTFGIRILDRRAGGERRDPLSVAHGPRYGTLGVRKGMSEGMTATWDLYVKELVNERPQDFATLVLPRARYLGRRESQYQTREIRLDRLIEVEYKGEDLLINFELQVKRDPKMGTRLLRYSLEATEEYELPVLSCVIYLQKIGKMGEPPLRVEVAKRQLLWFDYVSIELAEKTTQELRALNLLGLLPLFILSKGGKTYEVLDEVVARLEQENERELLALTRLMAERVFTSESDQTWLFRRFAMLRDIEDTPTYQRLVKKGREEGELLGTRRSIGTLVQARFPSLRSLVRERIEQITDLEKLQEILLIMGTARTAKSAREYLLTL